MFYEKMSNICFDLIPFLVVMVLSFKLDSKSYFFKTITSVSIS